METTTTATTATTGAAGPKRQTLIQTGMALMKEKNVLATTKASLETLGRVVKSEPTKAFDVLYVNVPWKNVPYDYLASLPVKNVTSASETNGLLMWVDTQYADKAVDLIRHWGFEFKSVLHTASYDRTTASSGTGGKSTSVVVEGTVDTDGENANTQPEDAAAAAANMVVAGGEEGGAGGAEGDAQSVSSAAAAVPAPTKVGTASRKQQVPPGWPTEGLVYSRSRQLWYAEAKGSMEDSVASRFLKDPSFIRKRLSQVSTFTYPEEDGEVPVTMLSAKKKNFEHLRIFPEFDVFVPTDLKTSLDQIFKPTARVLSLFADDLHKNWFTWGPNVPGYFSGPLRNDGGFPLVSVLVKYFGTMKSATANKYLSLVNLYAVQFAKQLGFNELGGEGGSEVVEGQEGPGPILTPLAENRLHDFINDLCARAETGGGIRESTLASAATIQLRSSEAFNDLPVTLKTQFLLMVAHVICSILRKNADAAEKRRRTTKRKRGTATEGEGGDEVKEPPRKYGIAAPVRISDDLADFMGLNKDEKVARTTVVKFINDYIGQNKLQNPEKRSTIMIDKDRKLHQLLKPDVNFGPVTYFNLCKLLGPHFINEKKAAAAAAAMTA